MRPASREATRRLLAAAAITVSVGVGATAASANEPIDLRVVSVRRGGGALNVVVSVPSRFAMIAPSDAFAVVGPHGEPLTPTVQALPPSATALAIVVHTAGAPPAGATAAHAVAAELMRTVDPAIPITLVTTSGGVVVTPLTLDRALALGALSRPMPDAPAAVPEALGAVAAQLAPASFVDPLVVVVDAGPLTDPGAALPAELPALGTAGMRIIPTGAGASPLMAQLADRLGLEVTAGVDPVSLVDEAAGWLRGRYGLSMADPGDGTLTVRLRAGGTDLTAPVTLTLVAPATTAPPAPATTASEPPPATPAPPAPAITGAPAPATTIALPAPTTAPTVPTSVALVVAPAVARAAPPGETDGPASTRWLMPVLGASVALAVLGGGGALLLRRRRAKAIDTADVTEWGLDAPPPLVPGFYYTDLSGPRPTRPAHARPKRTTVLLASSSPPSNGSSPSTVPIASSLPPPSNGSSPSPSPVAPPSPVASSNGSPPAPVPVDPSPSPSPVASSNGSPSPSPEPDPAYERRVRVLALAEEIGNISEACRIVGVSRRSFYEWKAIADKHGIEGLRSRRSRTPTP